MENAIYYGYDAVVVGSGAAGYNAACTIQKDGRKSVAIVTEGIRMGTSRNTGSDKQTYYKLALGGDTADSVGNMAENLFAGGSTDGDNALCEAALSARCFLRLCELGVPFPTNRFGEYIGYKTDHDPYARATSAGPLTSKYMTEALESEADRLHIPVFDNLLAIEILKSDNGICGLLCLHRQEGTFHIFKCSNIILATGGPAGIYADSVYPQCHHGSSGLALSAGASLQNMTEWQYGLASAAPRWNVSGTYMQVLPRFFSVDENGNAYEFLRSYFQDPYDALNAIFLKGYQWPFDSQKVLEGSSIIDLLVYRECVIKNRRVYLDYTQNPFGMTQIDFTKLSSEAYAYLNRANACFGTPIERLQLMNLPAVELYQSKGLDITKEPLEISLCAQHCNGGIAVDMWWQTEIPGLFAAGECAGTHGIRRPGGSALNAGQVGSLRAAQYICADSKNATQADFRQAADAALKKHSAFCRDALSRPDNADALIFNAQRRMSNCGGAIRNLPAMEAALREITQALDALQNYVGVKNPQQLYKAYRLWDALLVQSATLQAMIDFAKTVGETRGSALYFDSNGQLREGLDEMFRFQPDSGKAKHKIQHVSMQNNRCAVRWRDIRPIPKNDEVFETVWRQYRQNQNVY